MFFNTLTATRVYSEIPVRPPGKRPDENSCCHPNTGDTAVNGSQLMKKWEKVVFYEFNVSFALIFRKWKVVLNDLTLGIPN